MNKAIIVLTGTPSGKSKFDAIVTKTCWRWNINPKNWLAETARSNFYWKDERGSEEYHRKLAKFYEFVNDTFGYEEAYMREAIARFKAFDAEKMSTRESSGSQSQFVNFMLIIHGISKELTAKLEDEEGALQIHVTSKELNTNINAHDLVCYEDDEDFEATVEKVISVLMNEHRKENISA